MCMLPRGRGTGQVLGAGAVPVPLHPLCACSGVTGTAAARVCELLGKMC